MVPISLFTDGMCGTELSIYDALNSILEDLAAERDVPFVSALTKDIHVLPDFNGNRCAYPPCFLILSLEFGDVAVKHCAF